MNTIKVGSKTAAAAAALVKYVIDSNIPSLTPKRWQISNGKTHHLSSIKNVKISCIMFNFLTFFMIVVK